MGVSAAKKCLQNIQKMSDWDLLSGGPESDRDPKGVRRPGHARTLLQRRLQLLGASVCTDCVCHLPGKLLILSFLLPGEHPHENAKE